MPGFDDVFRRSSHVRFVEDLREVVSYGQMLLKTERRDWLEFCESFSLPKRNEAVVKKRVLINLKYYRVNYALICTALLGATAVLWSTTPFFVVTGSFLQAVYMFQHMYLRPLRILGRNFDHKEKQVLFAAVLVVKVIFMEALFGTSLMPTVFLAAVSAAVVASHAALRPQSSRSRFGTMGTAARASALDVEDGGLASERVKLYAPSADLASISTSLSGPAAAAASSTAAPASSTFAMDDATRQARNEAYAARRRQVIQRERQATRATGLAARNMWAEQTIVEEKEESEASDLGNMSTENTSISSAGAGDGPAVDEAIAKNRISVDADNAERDAAESGRVAAGKESKSGLKARPNVHLHVPARTLGVTADSKNKLA